MNGPQHYREAEDLIERSYEVDAEDLYFTLGRAQVHATLALAAATAYPAIKDQLGDETRMPREWTEVAG